MNRRQFLGTVSAGLLARPLLAAEAPKGLPVRTLGRTGIKVSILGFGSGSRFLMYKEDDKAIAALNQAIDLGITYIDTAHSYGDGKSEVRVGQVMLTRRKEVTLATKIAARTAAAARRQIELSLKHLNTDHVEVLHIHALKTWTTSPPLRSAVVCWRRSTKPAIKRSPAPLVLPATPIPWPCKPALERHDFDCTQRALNASFERLALPVAIRKKMGVIAMKVFGQEQLLGAAAPEQLLAYVLSLPVSLASVGMPRLELLPRNAALARDFTPMPPPRAAPPGGFHRSRTKARNAPFLSRPRGCLNARPWQPRHAM